MSIRKHAGWILCGLLVSAVAMAQSNPAAERKQLNTMKKQVAAQKAQVSGLKQQVAQLKQRNAEEKANLAARDQEIARLKAQLGNAASAPVPARKSVPAASHSGR